MMAGLRAEVLATWSDLACTRPPALRRADQPDRLLATDAPLVLSEADLTVWRGRMHTLGWRMAERGIWLLLTKALRAPEDAALPDSACFDACRSLLLRHPGGTSTQTERLLICKAQEMPADQQRKIAHMLQAEWAVRLRKHMPLPSDLLPIIDEEGYPCGKPVF